MAESNSFTSKLVGRVSYGVAPTVSPGANKEQMIFDIHNFSTLPQQNNEFIETEIITACGHPWFLRIFPRGDSQSRTDFFSTAIFLFYGGDNNKTNPVVAKANIKTKTTDYDLMQHEFSNETVATRGYGFFDFSTRQNLIEQDCDDVGTLTITVEIEVTVETRKIWYPRLIPSDIVRTTLYGLRDESSDVTFIVGKSKKELLGHQCIILLRAKSLHELIITEEASSALCDTQDTTQLELSDIDEAVFEVMLEFFYTDRFPKSTNDDHEKVRSILLTCDRFGCTDLKLYMESVIIAKFLIPSTVAYYLLLADSHSCALLKEAALTMYLADSKSVKGSNTEDWNRLKESRDLLEELLDYATSEKKKYVPIVNSKTSTTTATATTTTAATATTTTTATTSTIEDTIDEYDVTSLRERLEQFDLDVDGSKEILANRWTEYLRTTTTTTATATSNSTSN